MNTAKIIKHPLSPERVQVLDLPVGSRPLSAAIQPDGDGGARICLWTIGPAVGPTVKRRVVLVQTGDAISSAILDSCTAVATVAWVVARRDSNGNIAHHPQVEHVWLEREAAGTSN